jgi:hypothetical protein
MATLIPKGDFFAALRARKSSPDGHADEPHLAAKKVFEEGIIDYAMVFLDGRV